MLNIAPNLETIRCGQRVSSALYERGVGTIVAVYRDQAPGNVRALCGGVAGTGGTAAFDVAFDNGRRARRVPEAILRGPQWTVYAECVDAEAIAQAIQRAVEHQQAAAATEAAVMAEFAAEAAALRSSADLAHLTPAADRNDTAAATKNIRAHLKRTFSGVRFSVRTSRTGSVAIGWTDGPTERQVDAAVSPFRAGYFDGMTDSYCDERRPFGEVFGTARYITTRRELSPAIIAHVIDEAFSGYNVGHAARPSVEDFQSGACFDVPVPPNGIQNAETLQRLLRQLLARTQALPAGGYRMVASENAAGRQPVAQQLAALDLWMRAALSAHDRAESRASFIVAAVTWRAVGRLDQLGQQVPGSGLSEDSLRLAMSDSDVTRDTLRMVLAQADDERELRDALSRTFGEAAIEHWRHLAAGSGSQGAQA